MQHEAGESSYDAVLREVKEETGLDVSGAQGGYLFTYKRENPGEGDNYFVDVYRFVMDVKEEDLHLRGRRDRRPHVCHPESDQGICSPGKIPAL
ncbi:MAG: NUDIX domain-containing protein [Ruminococcus sp.]